MVPSNGIPNILVLADGALDSGEAVREAKSIYLTIKADI
jgi:hypothetical protein